LTEDIKNILTIAIASSALALTLYQIYSIRRHNYLGVRPFLQFGWSAGETGDSIWLRNVGLGSAIIQEFKMTKNGKPITCKTLEDELHDVGLEARMAVFTDGSVIQEKEKRWIVRTKDVITDGSTQIKFWDVVKDVEFEVLYKSFYEKSEPKLSWVSPNPIGSMVRAKPILVNDEKDNNAIK